MSSDQEFLLYPLDTGDDPVCPSCGLGMRLFADEVPKQETDILTFRCDRCGRSERRIICEK